MRDSLDCDAEGDEGGNNKGAGVRVVDRVNEIHWGQHGESLTKYGWVCRHLRDGPHSKGKGSRCDGDAVGMASSKSL